MSEVNSTMLQARYKFYKKHPEIAPIMANDNLIVDWAEENVQSLELLYSWELAARALEGKLALNTIRTEVQPPAPEAAAEAPTELVDLRKLSVPELREIVKGQRVDYTPKLPAAYTAERIRTMPAAELRQLQTKFSSTVLNSRLRGES